MMGIVTEDQTPSTSGMTVPVAAAAATVALLLAPLTAKALRHMAGMVSYKFPAGNGLGAFR